MEYNTHRDIQEKLINKLIIILGIIAIPVVMFSLLRYIDIGWNPVFYLHIAIAVTVVLFALLRKYASYNFKAWFLFAVFFTLAVSGAVSTGMWGHFVPYLMLTILVTIIFCGRKHAFLAYLSGAVILVVSGFFNMKGLTTPTIDIITYPRHLTSWLNTFTVFTGLTGLVVLVVGDIGNILSGKLSELEKSNHELTCAANEIRILQGILPICAKCKKVRDSNGYWTQVESYISRHSELKFSHSLCEKCSEELYGSHDWYKKHRSRKD